MRAWTMGNDVPCSLEAFSCETTRSYAIILFCICKLGAGPALACVSL